MGHTKKTLKNLWKEQTQEFNSSTIKKCSFTTNHSKIVF